MKIITTRVHGILDYTVGLFVAAMPWLLGFAEGGYETWVPFILGLTSILYSVLTNYEMGLLKAIPMRTHLVLDAISGLTLFFSPWLFGFSNYISTPHVVTGLLELIVVALTQPSTSVSETRVGPLTKQRLADNRAEY